MTNHVGWIVNLFKDDPDKAKAYWDEKAAQLACLGKLRNGEISLAPGDEALSLQKRAQRDIGHVDFKRLMDDLEVDVKWSTKFGHNMRAFLNH